MGGRLRLSHPEAGRPAITAQSNLKSANKPKEHLMDDQPKHKDSHENRDPLTGEPGSHPVGTSVGTAGGGVAGAAIGAAVGGPVGAAIGAVVGGVAGAYSGHGVAEVMNPTFEEQYWREHHASQSWADENVP